MVYGGIAVAWNVLCEGIFYLQIQSLYNYLLSKWRKEYDLLLSRNRKGIVFILPTVWKCCGDFQTEVWI